MDYSKITEAFAKLECVELFSHGDGDFFTEDGEYNPLSGNGLTYQAMIKYSVRIMGHKIYIDSMRNKSTVVNEDINNPLSVAKSIIECILKHNNLWSEK